MKDVFRILDKNKKAHLQKVVHFSSTDFPNSEWQALNLIESSAQEMLSRISSALPKGYSKAIKNVRLEVFKEPGQGVKLFVKAQLYQYSKKQYQLKVFTHEIDHKNRSFKLARAVYDIEVFENLSRRVA